MQGYNGTELLSDSLPGAFNRINQKEQTREQPWFVNETKSQMAYKKSTRGKSKR
jgi:hypothetical protein